MAGGANSTERGSALPLVGALVGVVVLLAAALVTLAAWAVDRAEAQSAADAAALAAVVEGRPGAVELAERNGAELVDYRETDDGVVLVEVRLGGAGARAAATLDGDIDSTPIT